MYRSMEDIAWYMCSELAHATDGFKFKYNKVIRSGPLSVWYYRDKPVATVNCNTQIVALEHTEDKDVTLRQEMLLEIAKISGYEVRDTL